MRCKYLLLILLVASLSSVAQQTHLGTKTPYQPQQTNYTKPPQGYKAVFINYIGRHGARFQTSAEKDLLVTDVLKQADTANALTEDGLALYNLMPLYQKAEKDKYGDITMLGADEQHSIAQRLQEENAGVFKNGKLLVEMTEKLRTQQSAKEFLSGLKNYDTASITSIIFPAKVDSILRFYDLSKAYKDYTVNASIKNHIDSLINDGHTAMAANDICVKIFKKHFIDSLEKGSISSKTKDGIQELNAVIFSEDLYEIFASMFDASKELQTNYREAINLFNKLFFEKDLQWFDMINCASDFYEKGPADNANGIQITIASPLLNDLIKITDSAIQHKKYNAVLRFTHAEAISPLATLMEIPQASVTNNSVYHYDENWKARDIIPMSANIQWILYSNGNNYLLKVMLNEKEVKLPVQTSTYPYYNWSDIKEYYLNKLSAINKNK